MTKVAAGITMSLAGHTLEAAGAWGGQNPFGVPF